jgi:hypothetical protein
MLEHLIIMYCKNVKCKTADVPHQRRSPNQLMCKGQPNELPIRMTKVSPKISVYSTDIKMESVESDYL